MTSCASYFLTTMNDLPFMFVISSFLASRTFAFGNSVLLTSSQPSRSISTHSLPQPARCPSACAPLTSQRLPTAWSPTYLVQVAPSLGVSRPHHFTINVLQLRPLEVALLLLGFPPPSSTPSLPYSAKSCQFFGVLFTRRCVFAVVQLPCGRTLLLVAIPSGPCGSFHLTSL